MIVVIPFLVILGITAGPVLARVKSTKLRRSCGWLWFISLTIAAHFILFENGAFTRMVGICCVLLGGMKGLVYAEWAKTEKLTLPRYAIFSFLWFGMDPGTFRFNNPKLHWKNDIAAGFLLMVIGLCGSWIVAKLEWQNIILMFLPLSIGFHFGVLRILKGTLRFFGENLISKSA